MTLRRRGMIRNMIKWMGAIGLGVVIGGGISFGYHFQSSVQQRSVPPIVRRSVITVNREVLLGEILNESDLEIMEVDAEMIPLGAYSLPEEVIGKKAWVNLTPKVMLQSDFFYREKPEFQVNEQEILVQKLPDHLERGDYVDLRIQFPSGHDYCVLSHKQVGDLWSERNMITLGLTEDERVRMGSAQTDAATFEKAYLYLSIYPKAVDMPNTPVRYPVNGSVQALYEEVTGKYVVGNERNHLEIALNQLKEEEKFLRIQAKSANKDDLPDNDKNLQNKEPNKDIKLDEDAVEKEIENEKTTNPEGDIKIEPTAQGKDENY